MRPVAYIVHSLPDRTRLRVPERRGSSDYFTQVIRHLDTCPGVTQAIANPSTASILVRHSVPFSEISTFAGAHELFTATTLSANQNRLSHGVAGTLRWLDEQLVQRSEGRLDVRSTVLMGLLALSAIQIARGDIMAPGITLLWYALQLTGVNEDDAGGHPLK